MDEATREMMLMLFFGVCCVALLSWFLDNVGKKRP